MHEEDVLGKAYDSRLMRRLLAYLRPYKWQVAIALGSIVIKSGADVLGPYLTKIAVDRYLVRVPGLRSPFDRFLSDQPLVGPRGAARVDEEVFRRHSGVVDGHPGGHRMPGGQDGGGAGGYPGGADIDGVEPYLAGEPLIRGRSGDRVEHEHDEGPPAGHRGGAELL